MKEVNPNMEAQLAGAERAEREVERALSGLERELNGARNVADELIGRLAGVLSPQNPQSEKAPQVDYSTELGRSIGDKTQTVLSLRERLQDTLERLEV
jgi:hypothetical protein